jgi:hypothetical protein
MPYQPSKHGRAEYGSYMQIPDVSLSGLVEGDESEPLIAQRFAKLVYSVNPSQLNISGATINVDTVGIDDSGLVQLSGDQLKVFDQAVVDAINNISIGQTTYSSVIQTRGTDVYIAEAPVGTSYATSAWRAQKIDQTGTTTWADNANFSQPANIELSGLTYNP